MGWRLQCTLLNRPRNFVSNPLGWDGDRRNRTVKSCGKAVSNPLGWDGDTYRRTEQRQLYCVSNPLGWDGDAATAVIGEEA